MIKTKYRANRALLLITIVAMALTFWAYRSKDAELAEQAGLKSEIVDDCNNLTKQVVLLEKQNKLLEERVESQNELIDRLMKLETVEEAKAVVMSEARGSSINDQAAVFQTMLDRTTWGISVKEAITASGQYADPYTGEISDSVNTAFDLVFLDGYKPFDELTTHFASNTPYWAENKMCRGKIGAHVYYGPEE